jgi:hypothetical protein
MPESPEVQRVKAELTTAVEFLMALQDQELIPLTPVILENIEIILDNIKQLEHLSILLSEAQHPQHSEYLELATQVRNALTGTRSEVASETFSISERLNVVVALLLARVPQALFATESSI